MKKLMAILLILILTLPGINIYSAPIYNMEETVILSDGVTLTRVKCFYADHNLTYSVIKADLSNSSTSLKLLTPSGGIDTFATVENLAKTDENTIGALNADFFSIYKGSKGFSLGIEIKDGNLLQSPINPDTMATVSYENDILSMGYLDFHIMAVAPNWEYKEIRHLNKHTSYYGDILMYTSEFNGGYSPAPGGEVVEVVVEDGKIKEFRRNQPSVKIPENGCVLVVSEGSTMFLANNFNVGDEIKFDYYITPDISGSDVAFGGGAMLVSNGNVVKSFSHTVSGYNPRSAIGVDKSGKTVYLVAVDGRQTSSRGMTMSELASLMAELGCYNAVNLDGGGSTNMVASSIWNENIHTVNSPSENRKVSNAVGIVCTDTDTAPSSVILEADREVVFVGDNVKISSKVVNKSKRPLPGSATLWSEQGNIYGEYFTPTVGGEVTVYANYGDASGSISVYCVDTVSGINAPGFMSIPVNQNKVLPITVFDSSGHIVSVEDTSKFSITSSDPSVVSVSGNTLTAHRNGKAIITVKKDNAVCYTSVNAGSASSSFETNTFDSLQGSFISYPSYVEGGVEVSSENYFSNGKSIQLNYDFSADNSESKAAYYALSPKIPLDNSCNEVSVRVYSPSTFNHSVRAQFTDGNGDVFRVKMCGELPAGEWFSAIASIPENAVRPITLDRIYALYTDGEKKDLGCIYLDDLSYEKSSGGTGKYLAAPQNVYDSPEFFSTPKVFRAGSYSFGTKTILSSLSDLRTSQKVSKAQTGMMLGNLKPQTKKEDANALYVCLDTSKGGIKATNSDQWNFLANAMAYSDKENVFILSDNSIFGNDAFENEVIKEYLASLNKNIFVITGGERNTYTNIGGVGYFTLANRDMEELSLQRVHNYSYLEFSLTNNPAFRWVRVFD